MGLSLRPLGRKLGQIASGVERQVNPFDNGASYQNQAPVQVAPQVQQSITHARYGVLANNPSLQQSFLNQARPTGFNPITAAPGAFGTAVKQGVVQPLINTAKLPVNFGSFLGAELSHDNPTITKATDTLRRNANNSIIAPLAQTAELGGGALAGRSILNNPNTTPEQKQAQLHAVNQGLAPAGFNLSDSPTKTALKEASLAAQDIATVAFAGKPEGKLKPLNEVGAVGKNVEGEVPRVGKTDTGSDFTKGEKVGFAGILSPANKARTGTFVRQVDKYLAEINYGDHTELNHVNNLYKLDQPTPVTQVGKTAKPIVKLKQPNLNEGAFSAQDQAYLTGLSDEEKANLPAKQQMQLAEMEGKASNTPLAPAAANTAKNPFKAPIPEVKQGDYKQIVSNEQTASNPALVAGDRWKQTMQNLQKTDPEAYQNFWKHVEDPKTAVTPELKQAIQAWREVDNRIHGTSQQLGGNTNYLNDHGLHPWNLPEEYAQHISNGGNPEKFAGLNSISRKYRTIAEGEANGLVLGDNPLKEGGNYISASAALLRRRAIIKGLGEADGHIAEKTHYLDLGGGQTFPMSAAAHKALRGLQKARYSENKAAVGIRTVNSGLRTTLLSGGQFHPINISVLRAGPSTALAGHPVRAIKGVVGTFTATKGRVGKMYQAALDDKIVDPGTGQSLSIVDAAAKIGAPYAQKGFDVEGSALKSGVGHKLVFEQQIPMMHNQVVRSVLDDLINTGVPLDSNAARQAGVAANSTMGFINKEALNTPTWVRKAMSDWMLASQFTPSKAVTLSKIAKRGVAGKYARADVLSNVAAATGIIYGVGYLLHQKSDSFRDSLLRAIVNPAIPTPMKDKKGNTVELRIPLTYTAEVSKILGIKLKRQADGHLGVEWKPSDALDPHGGLAEWMRSRLAPVQSSVVKLATNTNFADKPLSDPNAPAGTRAIQDATTIAQGYMPIGTQGIPNTKIVKDHVPGSVRDILESNTPGTNPVVKGLESSAGFTTRTDQTVGKGLETSQYFDALDAAKKGLNRQEADALDLYAGSKKNPVTGKYDVQPNANDSRTKASALLQNPKTLDKLVEMNQKLGKSGQSVDPLWSQSKDNIKKYLEYQSMAPGSADKTDWYNKNGSWYSPLVDQRNAFFDSLPKGDPNKPKLDIQYPDAPPAVKSSMEAYSNLTDPKQKAAFLDAHPDVVKQWNAQSNYTNKMREALGYSPLKNYPEATPQLQSFINQYSSSDKATKKGLRSANAQQYKNMISYFDSVDLYTIGKQASVSQLQGEPDYTSKEAKSIQGLAKDIYQNPDGSYSVIPAGWMDGLSNGSGGGYGSGGKKDASYGTNNPRKYAVSLSAGGRAPKAQSAPKVGRLKKAKVAKGTGSTKPKISLKKSLV